MKFSSLGQVIDVLPGAAEHIGGFCGIDDAISHEAGEIFEGERHFQTGFIERLVVDDGLFAPLDAVAVCLHGNG